MKNMRLALMVLGGCLSVSLQAVRIDTVKVASKVMQKDLPVQVVVPDAADHGVRCPVVYLLHGYGGNAGSWLQINPSLVEKAERDSIIIVCPDGKNSWYWDSPLKKDSRFETYVSRELTDYIDRHYSTEATREGRAVTGYSMGGHGAFWLAFHHKDVFGAAGSTSGGVDIRPFPENWEMKSLLGEKSDNPSVWDQYTVTTQLDLIKNGDLALIFDCGTADFFFEVNKRLHEEMLKRGIGHDFIVRPGAHTGEYWANAIEYQWVFFHRYFKQNRKN